jgi:anaerobic ribonucleoside-triphosphate reductase
MVEECTNNNIENNEVKRRKCEIYSRTVGYLRPINQWNTGKQQEFKDRKYFKVD